MRRQSLAYASAQYQCFPGVDDLSLDQYVTSLGPGDSAAPNVSRLKCCTRYMERVLDKQTQTEGAFADSPSIIRQAMPSPPEQQLVGFDRLPYLVKQYRDRPVQEKEEIDVSSLRPSVYDARTKVQVTAPDASEAKLAPLQKYQLSPEIASSLL